ncbi:YvrJ family protein [Fictibacillus nanhaiensis]|uniref:YvrJ family protein n=1 Tax=Fictibacillus nanhaiensis TaxID=742169 RepID=UPI002E234073|nr:YvrJ family protein [Fictibacillus nanhaiensis]
MDLITLPTWITIIGNFGFPVMVTIYLLHRFEKRIETLTAAIDQLKNVVDRK